MGLAGLADPEVHARALRATVLQHTGIPVSVGIAPTKVLAKVANRTAKKDPTSGGVCQLAAAAAQTAALAHLELGDLWGIGHRLVPCLTELGITTPLQLRDACPTQIRQRFNVVLQRLVLELKGTPCLYLKEHTPDRKTIMASRSLGSCAASTFRNGTPRIGASYHPSNRCAFSAPPQ